MKPATFQYEQPTRIADALHLLADSAEEGGKVIAGGQSLVPMMNFRLVQPPVLIDLNRIEGLRQHSIDERRTRIGAMTTTGTIATSGDCLEHFPLLAHAAGWVGHTQIRSRGTVGGSLSHADPAAEMPAIMQLCDARLTVASVRGERTISSADFFLGYMTTSLEENEILTSIELETPALGTRWGFAEFAQRHGDFAEAGASCILAPPGGRSRIVVFGAGDHPFRPAAVETLLNEDLEGFAGAPLAAAVEADAAGAGVSNDGVVRLLHAMVERAVAMAQTTERSF